jgi:hypothetical protein
MSDPNKYFWSEHEIAKLKELYPTTSNREIAKVLGRTELAVKSMAIRLGLKKDPDYLGNLPSHIRKGQHLSPETEFKKGHMPLHSFPKGHIPWNKGLKGIRLSPKTGFKDTYGFSLRNLRSEYFLANYVIDNPKDFGYVKVYLCPASNFDLLGIKEDGTVERIELEHGLSDFLYYHDPSECDRVIAVYNTKKPFPLPYTIVDRKKFAEYVKKLIDKTGGLIC